MVFIASLTSFDEHEGEVSRYEASLDQFDELMSNRDIASIATIVVLNKNDGFEEKCKP
jgi:50S ribosomal subunit-associated GTPase HflX